MRSVPGSGNRLDFNDQTWAGQSGDVEDRPGREGGGNVLGLDLRELGEMRVEADVIGNQFDQVARLAPASSRTSFKRSNALTNCCSGFSAIDPSALRPICPATKTRSPAFTADEYWNFSRYGKGPGVDRSGDAIKHANMSGTHPNGGVLLAFGDDHAGKSSSLAHQSDLALAAHEVPILYPSDVHDIFKFGLAGFVMSRECGLLAGLKLVNETAGCTRPLNSRSTKWRRSSKRRQLRATTSAFAFSMRCRCRSARSAPRIAMADDPPLPTQQLAVSCARPGLTLTVSSGSEGGAQILERARRLTSAILNNGDRAV